MWDMILAERGGPPVCYRALQETREDTSALDIAKGNVGGDWGKITSYAFKHAWTWYKRRIKDLQQSAAAVRGSQKLSKSLAEHLRPHVGKAAMVAGYRSNTFGGIVSDKGTLYILSLNTRPFRTNSIPWLTATSAESLQKALNDPYASRHLRIYWAETNAPTLRARKWAEEQGLELLV